MKIYINREPVTGPWGGGNKTLSALCDRLKKNNDVVFQLEKDIDVIFCFDPRPNSKGIWYQHFLNYKNANPGTKIIQRVGDVGTHSKPELTELVKQSTQYSDYVIFPSLWAKNYINYNKENFKIIPNAAEKVFHKGKKCINEEIDKSKKIKIVTHHWSDNPKKGFLIYSKLGKLISERRLENFEFTYIGRYNKSFPMDGIKILNPLPAEQIADELINYDVYLTASLEEAGANHVLEAMASGLPVLYRVGGGSINEYCKDHGVEYNDADIENLNNLIEKLNNQNFKEYNNTIDDTITKYEDLIINV